MLAGKSVYYSVSEIIRWTFRENKMDQNVLLSVEIEPDGRLSSTNFANTDYARYGLALCVGMPSSEPRINLVLPDRLNNGFTSAQVLSEIDSAEYLILSVVQKAGAFDSYAELLFEDHSQSPFVLVMGRQQFNCPIGEDDDGTTDIITDIYTAAPKLVLRKSLETRVRIVESLPCLKPW